MKKLIRSKNAALTVLLVFLAASVVFVVTAIVLISFQSGDKFADDGGVQNISQNSYYYNFLPESEQYLYDEMLSAALEYREKTEVIAHKYSPEEYDRVVLALEADHPELFFIDFGQMSLETSFSKSRVTIGYIETPEKMDSMRAELDAALDAALSALRAAPEADELGEEDSLLTLGEFELEVLLHDYLCSVSTYYDNGEETETENRYLASTAYGALVSGEAFSDGYSLAMKLLSNKAGLACIIVRGTADGKPHVWNVMYIDGKFYHVDVAYNDADIEFAPELKFHGYFNLTSDEIKKDHTIDSEQNLPAAQTDYNYYRAKNLHAENLMDLDRIAYREILNAVYSGKNYIELYTTFSREGDSFKEDLLSVISRVNKLQDDKKLKVVFRVYNASATNNALTIQLYYEEETEA